MKIFKPHLRNCALFVMLFTVLLSCTRKNDDVIPKNPQLKASDFNKAGVEHNERLNEIFNALKNSKKTLSRSNLRLSVMQDDVLAVAEMESINQINADTYPSDEVRAEMVAYTIEVYDNIPITEEGKLYNSETAATLNPSQINIIDEVNTLLNDDDQDINSLHNRISLIESEIPNLNLTEAEQSTLYITTNTARHSLTYWYENYDAWQQLANTGNRVNGNSNSLRTSGFSWKRVGRGDVAGAVAGVAAWGGAAIFGGPTTWTAFGISVGGWAAGCSAYEAIMQLW